MMLKAQITHVGNGLGTDNMPHSVASMDAEDEEGERLFQRLMNPTVGVGEDEDPGKIPELEPGEKADDAIDYEDLSDDDLAEDEDEKAGTSFSTVRIDESIEAFGDLNGLSQEDELPELTNGSGPEGDGFDELFGEEPSSPVDLQTGQSIVQPPTQQNGMAMSFGFDDDERFPDTLETVSAVQFPQVKKSSSIDQRLFQHVDSSAKDTSLSKEQQMQQELFAMSRSGFGGAEFLPAPPENQEELLASLWPKFERNTVPRFMDLLPPKKARYVGKTPLKKPKPVQPTKISLELAVDQEKTFRIPGAVNKKDHEESEHSGFILISEVSAGEKSSDEDVEVDSDFENETIGGVTWQDLQIICEDWDIPIASSPESEAEDIEIVDQDDLFYDVDENQDSRPVRRSTKRRKLNYPEAGVLATPHFAFPSLHDPQQMTAKIAKSVTLDLNDPRLLLDISRSEAGRPSFQKRRLNPGRDRGVTFGNGLNQRYNISNDEAYDLLKENHQSKVRSTLGNLAVSHSMPAVRLQWPYYKTKLEKQEARSFHRPAMFFQRNEPVMFSKPRVVKKKHMKGKDIQSIFESTRDLSLGDNSSALLLEYSEEYPAMMSNFGMGNRLVNYYRRKNMEDTTRPKLDIGETTVLLPQDKSPFSVFGHIDPGQITPTLYNGMYRAPIFKQEPKPTDFLVIRNTTGIQGSAWYIRSIENIHVVGQEFPATDVPGPHSRKVTTASKNRLKMISYRQIRRNKPHRIGVCEVTKHFTDTTDMQNRQKMKEFMQFSKEHKEWEMRPGEPIPDEEAVRTMVKPEDVCLLESMQVGQQHLQDAGFGKGDDSDEDDENKEGQSIEQQLAPWYTSRNFLNAAQGKAMLQLHGEGDPSGRGEAFSFIKTSMKGGFKAIGESVEDKLDAKKLKELGGHSYNVARQQRSYEESIRRIWEAQRQSLSSTLDHSDTDMDEYHLEQSDDQVGPARTPRSEAQTPAAFRRKDDETTSQFSRFSTDSQTGKVLKITRDVRDKYSAVERVQEVIRDPRVIRQYLKRRHAKEAESLKLSELKPSGNVEQDKRYQQRLEKELARLERNKDRRIARDKQKGIYVEGATASPGSPSSPATTKEPKNVGTQRKCANCGQVGHIKTNKKLCPLLNGTMKQEDGFTETAFTLGAPTL